VSTSACSLNAYSTKDWTEYESGATPQAKLPRGLAVDLYQGVALLSIVAISECGIEPRIPLLPLSVQAALAVSHHAVNVRTYVRPIRGNGPPGIYFFSLDCSTGLPALGARLLFNLPYKVASMSRTHASPESHSQHEFISQRQKRTIFRTEPAGAFHAVWSAEGSLQEAPPGSLAEFVVERYCLYCERGLVLRCLGAAFLKLKRLWRGDIDHAPWPLQRARVELLENTMLRPIGFEAAEPFDAHYSTGVGSIDFFFAG